MKPTVVGYSGTALAKKLGIKEGSRVFVVDAPKDYAKLVEPLPPDVLAKLQPAGTIWEVWSGLKLVLRKGNRARLR